MPPRPPRRPRRLRGGPPCVVPCLQGGRRPGSGFSEPRRRVRSSASAQPSCSPPRSARRSCRDRRSTASRAGWSGRWRAGSARCRRRRRRWRPTSCGCSSRSARCGWSCGCAPRASRRWCCAARSSLSYVVLLLGPPLSLTDIFNYLHYGRMLPEHGLNPYVSLPVAARDDPTYLYSNWHHLPSPYGPLFTLIGEAVARAVGARRVLDDQGLVVGLLAGDAGAGRGSPRGGSGSRGSPRWRWSRSTPWCWSTGSAARTASRSCWCLAVAAVCLVLLDRDMRGGRLRGARGGREAERGVVGAVGRGGRRRGAGGRWPAPRWRAPRPGWWCWLHYGGHLPATGIQDRFVTPLSVGNVLAALAGQGGMTAFDRTLAHAVLAVVALGATVAVWRRRERLPGAAGLVMLFSVLTARLDDALVRLVDPAVRGAGPDARADRGVHRPDRVAGARRDPADAAADPRRRLLPHAQRGRDDQPRLHAEVPAMSIALPHPPSLRGALPRQVVRFAVVGASNTARDVHRLHVAARSSLPAVAAAVLGWGVGAANGYRAQPRLDVRERARAALGRSARYLVVQGLAAGVSAAGVVVLGASRAARRGRVGVLARSPARWPSSCAARGCSRREARGGVGRRAGPAGRRGVGDGRVRHQVRGEPGAHAVHGPDARRPHGQGAGRRRRGCGRCCCTSRRPAPTRRGRWSSRCTARARTGRGSRATPGSPGSPTARGSWWPTRPRSGRLVLGHHRADAEGPARRRSSSCERSLDALEGVACVDRSRVFVTGVSNGGGMTARLACELSDRLAGAAPVAGGYRALPPCHPDRPLPILEIHGTGDQVVPVRRDRAAVRGQRVEVLGPLAAAGRLYREGAAVEPGAGRARVRVEAAAGRGRRSNMYASTTRRTAGRAARGRRRRPRRSRRPGARGSSSGPCRRRAPLPS